MIGSTPSRRLDPSEDGYIMVALIFMLAILILSMAVAVPRVRESIQRDRELETMERGKQYIRAIQLYYKKFNSYPPNIDALVKTNNIRFLRKKYIDPTTGKEEWKPILFGQNKTPMAMGFFGQPLAAASGGGIGPSGGNGPTGTSNSSSGMGLFNSNSSGGSTGAGTSTGTNPSSPIGTAGGSIGGTDANGNPISIGNSTSGSTSTTSGTTPAAGTSSPSGSATTSGQTFGGGGIIGFSPQSPKQSILTYKKKNHYNEWEFLYSPLSDQQQIMSGGNTGTIGQPASSTTTPVGGSTTPSAPTTPTAPANPTTPQQ